MTTTMNDTQLEVMLPVGDLHARSVWTEAGELLGHVRGVRTDDRGHVTTLVVREGWIRGRHHDVPAGGMRIDHGDLVVPGSAASEMVERELEPAPVETVPHAAEQAARPMPVFVQGREHAHYRFGGLDAVGALLGSLVMFATLALLGGALVAAFGTSALVVDTDAGTFASVTSTPWLVGLVSIAAAGFLGGWAAGRCARFDGIANGLLSAVLLLGMGLLFGALGRGIGSEHDQFRSFDLPSIVTDGAGLWGVIAAIVLLGSFLVASAVGGALGEAWHRHADRAMLDVVPVNEAHGHRWRTEHRPSW
jgi:hypothetical protein